MAAGVPREKHVRFPYKQAGLTEAQAAAHLIGRFTFGATPGQVDEVCKEGLERWFNRQLDAREPDDSLDAMLSGYDALNLSNDSTLHVFLRRDQLVRMAKKEGVIPSDSAALSDPNAYKDILESYRKEKGVKLPQELYRQFYNQKVLRAAFSNNQLLEVMTDFWFNHFNVSVTKGDCAIYIPAYERDVVRPNALGKFSDLLLATAKSPAMLYYLDNFNSRGGGINENYAREVMELHTLGVDGGYTQSDVTQAARVLTGWTVYPIGPGREDNPQARKLDAMSPEQLSTRGFYRRGDFFFNPGRHDKDEKTVLGKTFGPDATNTPMEGYQEGVDLLEMLAHHPSTAHFICRKLAVRFVSDDPPASLINKMAKTFLDKDGDIRQVLLTMVSAPEFWSPGAVREKIKSPFELAISSVRSLHASVDQPQQLYNWVSRMGEKLYSYQAPTGFPDKGQYWINTGSLLNRMNFGLAMASGRIPGIHFDLIALNDHHEPESAQAALVTYSRLLMPERQTDETVKRLTPMLNDPALGDKVATASGEDKPGQSNAGMLPQVVGIILGSPEFQRR